MTTTINASTTAGLVQTADTSGSLQLQTANTAALTIDTSQNVGIGRTDPNRKLGVKSSAVTVANFESTSASNLGLISFSDPTTTDDVTVRIGSAGNALVAQAGGAERMRIDSSGNVLVGTTTGLDGGNGATIKQASYYISSYRVSSTAGNYVHAFYSDVGGTATAKYAIYANGTAGAISDERYKKNIEPSRNYLDDLTKIDVIKYNWATDEDGTPKELGFSAQQVETIFPALVDTVDNKDADGNVLSNQKILKRDVFLPMLIKAIQEQQTIINDLKARVTALEAK